MKRTAVRPRLQRLVDRQSGAQTLQSAIEHSTIGIWAKRMIFVIVLVWALSPLIGFISALTILTLLGFSAAVIGLRMPALGLLGIGMLSTLDALTRHYLSTGGFLRWNTFNYWLIIVILLSLPFILRLNDPNSRLLQIFLLLLSLWLLISPGISEGIQTIFNVVATFGLLVYFARQAQEDKAFYWLGIMNGILATICSLAFYLQIDKLPYIDPNSWAHVPLMALFSICLGFQFAKDDQRGRLIMLLLAVINFIWIILSASRGNIFNSLVCLVYLFLAMRSLTWRTLFLAALFVFGFWTSALFVEQQTQAITRLEKLFDPTYTLASRTSGRSRIAQAGWELFREHPLGVGTGGFRVEASRLEILRSRGRVAPAHSAWIGTLAENGFIGFISLCAFVASFMVVGWYKGNQELFLFGAFVTITFIVAFISSEFQGKSLWFLAAGAIVLLHRDMIRFNLIKATQSRIIRTIGHPRLRNHRNGVR